MNRMNRIQRKKKKKKKEHKPKQTIKNCPMCTLLKIPSASNPRIKHYEPLSFPSSFHNSLALLSSVRSSH